MTNLSLFKALLIVFFMLGSYLYAQTPQAFKYQAVIRNNSGHVIQNQHISLRIGILEGTASGNSVYSEEHAIVSNDFGLVNLVIGNGNVISGDFESIPWGENNFFLQVEMDTLGGNAFQMVGTSQLLSVPYAIYADQASLAQQAQLADQAVTATYVDSTLWKKSLDDIYYNQGNVRVGTGSIGSTGKLQVMSDASAGVDDVIFCVQNANGDTVFAVFQEGVRIWVSDNGTGNKAAGNRGGFAVGGFSPAKGITNEYLRVTPDSVRVYIEEGAGGLKATGNRGGFAVGGFSTAKTFTDYYMNVEYNNEPEIINPSAPRILWYPYREAFRTGRVLITDVDSVGVNSMATGFESKAIGNYSQALGFQARAFGNNSTAIGYLANADSTNSYALGNYTYVGGLNSYAIGDSAYTTGENSYAIGAGAEATGDYSFAFGSRGLYKTSPTSSTFLPTEAPRATANYAYAFGMGSVADNIGAFSFGTLNTSSGYHSTAIGYRTTATDYCSTSMGCVTTASGLAATAMGWYCEASGETSTAFGSQSTASGSKSTAMGFHTIASGITATTMGAQTIASEEGATAMGIYTSATGKFSTSMGIYTTAQSAFSVVLGRYNLISGSTTSWVDTDPLFVIGNGGSSTTRHNAMMVKKNGEVYFPDVYADAVGATNKDLYIDNNGKIGYLSSARRYKKNIRNMEDVDWLYDLRPVNYLYKNDELKIMQYGLIAEEVENVNPLFVSYSKEGRIETVQYSKMISPMIKALQDQREKIQELEGRIEQLQEMEARLKMLEDVVNLKAEKE